jgi:hypothetical protein
VGWPYLEKTHHQKWAPGVAGGVGPEFKPSTTKKKSVKWEFIETGKSGREEFLELGGGSWV